MATLRIVGGKGNRKKLEHLSQEFVQGDKWYWPEGQEIDSRHELISLMREAVKILCHLEKTMNVEVACV